MPPRDSWTSILASTMGMSHDTLRANVSVAGLDPEKPCWLVVQAFLAIDRVRLHAARPISAAVRKATGAEMATGVDVDVVMLDTHAGDDILLVAWVERRTPESDLDGIDARPPHGVAVGVSRAPTPGRDGVWAMSLDARIASRRGRLHAA